MESLPDEREDDDDDFCSRLRAYQYYNRCVLQYAFDCQRFRYQHTEKDLSFPSANTRVTLRDLLETRAFSTTNMDSTKAYSPCDRYLLGLNLADSLFYLFDGPWDSTIWKAEDIIFLVTQGPTLVTLHSRHSPYVRCSLSSEDEEEIQTKRKSKGEQLCYPMWLALAQILVELHLGRNLLSNGGEALGNVALRRRLLDLIKSEFVDSEDDAYKEAIEACLNFGFKLLATRPRERRKEERNLIRNDIISKLEKNYKKWSSALPQSPDLSLTPDMQSEKTEEVVPSPSDESTSTVFSPSPPVFVHQTSHTRVLQNTIPFSDPHLLPGISILRLFDDSESSDERHIKSSEKLFHKIDLVNGQYIEPLKAFQKASEVRTKIKVAVLDSGVDARDGMIRGALKKKRIRGGWGPKGTKETDFHDTYGHGTHVTRLLLKTAPLAEIHVAKISEGRNLDEAKVQDIVDAIAWAVNTVDADIITMSFGMQKEVNEITNAIYSAVDRGKLIFAAAANEGGLQPRAYPARLAGVICIHATDGYGNPATFNPNPGEIVDNFSMIGLGIESSWASETVFKSGTSFATPVAAGITASILDFVRTHLTRDLDKPEYLYSYQGMRHLLRSISPLRSQYHFISPWNVFRQLDDTADRQKDLDTVCEELRNFITKAIVPEHWKR